MPRLGALTPLAVILVGLAVIVSASFALRRSDSDYAGLPRYENADRQLSASRDIHRTVFFGDSITELWDLDLFFPGKAYVNRGIIGQTTSQMVLRFHQDVVDLKPEAVIILAGINDVDLGIPVHRIEANYAAMLEMARSNGITVYFGSLLPAANVKRFSPEKIHALNRWLRDYCAASGAVYVNYSDQMSDLKALTGDGLHPNKSGYSVMSSVLSMRLSQR